MEREANGKQVVIVGGGITGLSTAYYLEQAAKARGKHLRCVLLEADRRLGGKIKTDLIDDFVIEAGPDSFLQRKPQAVQLCRELGIAGELVGTNPHNRKTYILHKGKLHRIPQGLNIGIPTQFLPFVTTGLLSLSGKLRAGLDLVLPKRPSNGDQSLGFFLERRLGTEVVDYLAEPLLAGIYAGDLRKLSLRATFPQFEQLEQQYGSLVRGMLAQARQAKAKPATQTKPELGQPAVPNTVFVTFPTGLERLVRAIAEALTMTDVRLSTPVERIEKRVGGGYTVHLPDAETLEADAIVMTAPTFDAAKILPAEFVTGSHLTQVPYVSVATCVLTFDKGQIDYPLDGTGFVIPHKEGRTITACTWTSSKWTHTAKNGKVLMRCYVGRDGEEAIVERSDEEIVAKVRADVADIMGIKAEPMFTRVARWRKSMPQYTVGHLDRVRAFVEKARRDLPGIFFAGAGYTGLGIPDCIGQGKTIAEETLSYLNQ
jgi:oxygen-dependent protoporphyrinogen oxidase